jgi:hypothetical protein
MPLVLARNSLALVAVESALEDGGRRHLGRATINSLDCREGHVWAAVKSDAEKAGCIVHIFSVTRGSVV